MFFLRASLAVTVSLHAICFVQTISRIPVSAQHGDVQPEHPWWVMLAAHSHASLFRFHCLANSSSTSTRTMLSNDDLSASVSCCELVQSAVHHLLVLHEDEDEDDDDNTRTVKKNIPSTTITAIQNDCLRNIVRVPLIPPEVRPRVYPTHSYVYYNSENTTSHHRSDAASFIRPDDWKQYLYDGETNALHAIEKSEFPKEFQSLLRINNESSSSSIDSFRAMLVLSELSQSGGMHRLWHQRIQLGKDMMMIPANRRMKQLQLYILIHLPADFFVDMEDTFDQSSTGGSTNDSLQLELVTLYNDTIIDIEEPAFTSPAHAILVRLTKTNLQPDDDDVDEFLSFVIKIHLRYPQPVGEHNDQGAFRKVLLPAPMLVAGSLEWRRTSDIEPTTTTTTTTAAAAAAAATFRLSPWSTTTFMISGQQHAPMLETWVAAGHAQDLLPVLCVTLVVAMTGAIIMMRDIVQVAKWGI